VLKISRQGARKAAASYEPGKTGLTQSRKEKLFIVGKTNKNYINI